MQRSGGEALLASPPGKLHKFFNKEIKLQLSGRRRVSPLCENLAFSTLRIISSKEDGSPCLVIADEDLTLDLKQGRLELQTTGRV